MLASSGLPALDALELAPTQPERPQPRMSRLELLPPELIIHIARIAADADADEGRAAPTLLALLQVTQRIHNALDPATADQLYADLFESRFDTAAIGRRFGREAMSARVLAVEYRRRVGLLGLMRAGDLEEAMDRCLWLAYLMALEDDGFNFRQLVGYGRLTAYIDAAYNLEIRGVVAKPGLPHPSTRRALILAISEYLLARGAKVALDTHQIVLKPYVFAAHRYNTARAPLLMRNLPRASAPADLVAPAHEYHGMGMIEVVEHLGQPLRVGSPLIAPSAIMLYARLVEPDIVGGQIDDVAMAVAASARVIDPARRLSQRFDQDFYRLLATADPHDPRSGLRQLSRPAGHIPCRGQLEGNYSGRFSFLDFAAYRSMLVGRVASAYEGSVSDQLQVWRIEEHVRRLEPDEAEGGTGPIFDGGFKPDWRLEDEKHLLLPGEEPEPGARYEVLITGRGHSAWGSFGLRGRVRSWDGLITLRKLYDADGGEWLYRGYLVGGDKFVGRWRDSFTDLRHVGYEGPFMLARREEAE